MTEWNPEDDHTRPIPTGGTQPPAGSRHSYAEQSGDPRPGPVGGFAFAQQAPPEPPRPRRSVGAGLVAGLLAGALVVGGIAGLAGAAGYDKVTSDGDTSNGSTQNSSSSPVIDRGSSSSASSSSVESVASAVLPSVVKINVSGNGEQGSGSGVIISSDGEILTNNHVASVAGNGGTMTVNFNDGSAKRAKIVGTDPVTDLAVIKAEDVSGLRAATIGKTTKVDVGENVVAIGSPFGLQATVTSGIVSALNRPVSVSSSEQQAPQNPFGGGQGQQQQGGDSTTYPAIQTDAAINPGNSGGPLVDMNGNVIGINSSIRTASDGSSGSGGSIGLGFAIPIERVWPIVEQLRAGDKPTHAQMGVSVTDANSQNGLVSGAGIEQVNNGSAAQKAGLKKGDVVTKVDGQVITGSESLVATVRGHRPGDKVDLTVVQDGKTRQVPVTLDSDAG